MGLERAVPECARLQTHPLDRTTTVIGEGQYCYCIIACGNCGQRRNPVRCAVSVLRITNRHLPEWRQGSWLLNPCILSSCLWIVNLTTVSGYVTSNDRWLIIYELSSNLPGRKRLCPKLLFDPCMCYLQEPRKVTKFSVRISDFAAEFWSWDLLKTEKGMLSHLRQKII